MCRDYERPSLNCNGPAFRKFSAAEDQRFLLALKVIREMITVIAHPNIIVFVPTPQIWADWQKKSKHHKEALFRSEKQTLPGTKGLLPSQLIDNAALPGGVRVEYAAINNTQVANTLGRLRGKDTNSREMDGWANGWIDGSMDR